MNIGMIWLDGTSGRVEGEKKALVHRCQVPQDKANLLQLVPHDQVVYFRGRWTEANVLELQVVPVEECDRTEAAPTALEEQIQRLAALPDAKLKTLAAERHVKWDREASREAMVQRIAAATANAMENGKG